ncbi:hypothetical protein [Pilimelia anulata]|uniref:hypothetical protein n=1 Tax=Pilimelia anulata TaxID=53371 RepID=UPI0016658E3E|nr:hypothetical protein [Pilimelia anulata]
MRRRDLLAGPAGTPLAGPRPAAAPPPGDVAPPPADVVGRLAAALRHPDPVPAAGPGPAAPGRALAAVKAEFRASRYAALARTLPALLAAADRAGRRDAADAVRAEAYNTAAHVLIKLGVAGPAWVAAARAMAAAGVLGDPLVLASVTRNVASLCRGNGRYGRAQRLALAAAGRLRVGARP